MAEIEIGDMKMSGSKLLLIIPLLGTIGGGMWAGFEVYQRLLDAEEAIQTYVAPDLSAIEKKLDVIDASVKILNDQYSAELDDMDKRIRATETLVRSVDSSSAETQRDVRNTVYTLEQRVNNSIRDLDKDVRDVRKELDDKIKRILDNPLNNEN